MKYKKLLLIFILFLTGCSANYDISLEKNGKIKENVEIQIDNNDTNVNHIKEIKNNLNEKINYKLKIVDDNIVITYEKNYNNIEDYILNSIAYKQYFNDIEFNKSSVNTTINAISNFNKNSISINNDNINKINYLQINLKSNLNILEENSDVKSGNVYSWIYNGKSNSKKIYFKYSSSSNDNIVKSIITISTILIITIITVIIIYKNIKRRKKFY